jgi:hypothetical protein
MCEKRRAGEFLARRFSIAALIHGKQLVLDAVQNQRVQPRAKIHLVSDDGREFLAISELLKADVLQHARLKFRQHVHVALLGVKIVAQDRTEQAQFTDAAFLTGTRNLLAVNRDGQFGDTHAKIVAEMGGLSDCSNY